VKQVVLLISILAAVSLAACSKSDNDRTSGASSSTTSDNTQTATSSNTGVTASDQPENETDRNIVQNVRQALTSDSSLSTSAQNVTVVSKGGTVTLRGSVKDASEKQKVQDKATQVAGVSNVDNQLTVTQ